MNPVGIVSMIVNSTYSKVMFDFNIAQSLALDCSIVVVAYAGMFL